MTAAGVRRPAAGLLDLRDELATATSLVTALWLACQAPHLPEAERRALCALAGVARDALETCVAAADRLLPAEDPAKRPDRDDQKPRTRRAP